MTKSINDITSRVVIRREAENDYREVEQLTREAFWNVYRPGCDEHLVLHKLRSEPYYVQELSCVAELDGKIVAHIAYAVSTLRHGESATPILLFGPVSVLPGYQGIGLGSQLIRHTLSMAGESGWEAVVISGNPDYYGRFGFVPAHPHGIIYSGMSAEDEAPFFMVKFLDSSADGRLKGVYTDPACYTVDAAELEEFDKAFPPKVKEKRPGQLV